MNFSVKYISLLLVLFLLFSCKKKEEVVDDMFRSTIWEAKQHENAVDQTTHRFRLIFDEKGQFRLSQLDKDGFVYRTSFTGTYSFEDPYLTLRADWGEERVLIFRPSPNERLYFAYYGVNFYRQ